MKLNTLLHNEYFPALTGIRAMAAYMIFISHYNFLTSFPFGNIIFDFFNQFYIGVTFFFVLSGFLITHKYYTITRGGFKKYIVNRLSRIYPMYFILTTLTFVYLSFHSDTYSGLFITYLLNISFLKGLFNELKFSGLAQGWTMTVEAMFYFSAPFLFILVKRRGNFFLALVPIALFVVGVVLTMIFRNLTFYGFFDSFRFIAVYTFFGRASEFFINYFRRDSLKTLDKRMING